MIGVWSAGLHRPAVVLGNLLGGMTMLGLAWWLALAQLPRRETPGPADNTLRPWALLGIAVIGLQILSGALTSAEFAALACVSFPDCQGTWWPAIASSTTRSRGRWLAIYVKSSFSGLGTTRGPIALQRLVKPECFGMPKP